MPIATIYLFEGSADKGQPARTCGLILLWALLYSVRPIYVSADETPSYFIYPLTDDKFIELSNLKAFAADK